MFCRLYLLCRQRYFCQWIKGRGWHLYELPSSPWETNQKLNDRSTKCQRIASVRSGAKEAHMGIPLLIQNTCVTHTSHEQHLQTNKILSPVLLCQFTGLLFISSKCLLDQEPLRFVTTHFPSRSDENLVAYSGEFFHLRRKKPLFLASTFRKERVF